MKLRQGVAVVLMILICAGCAHRAPHGGSVVSQSLSSIDQDLAVNRAIAKQERLSNAPNAVDSVLFPEVDDDLSGAGEPVAARRFNLAVEEVPAKAFFTSLVKDTPYSVVIDPKVSGKISLNLKNVTIDDVLLAVRDTYGYGFRQTSYGFEVLPSGLQTRVFNVSYLNITRKGHTLTSINSGQPTVVEGGGMQMPGNSQNNSNSNANANPFSLNGAGQGQQGQGGNIGGGSIASSSVSTESETDFWRELKQTLKALVGTQNGRSFVVQPQAGIVIVRADSGTLREVQDYLQIIQNNMNRTVILEAKIIEVKLNDGFQSGVNWSMFKGMRQGNDESSDFANIFTVKARVGDVFSGFMKLLSTQGNVQVLSNPRISTINNQKAVIKVGKDRYFVTGISTTTVGSAATTNNLQDVDMTPFFSGIALDVTPQIDREGDVILHIHPSVSTVSQEDIEIDTGNTTGKLKLPSAASVIRESDSIVRAKNGQVVVIGGLMKDRREEDLNSTPFLGDIPVLGSIFRDTKQAARKIELVILLRPIVVKTGTWQKQLEHLHSHFKQMDQGFHFGNKPEVFGNLGEKKPAWLPQDQQKVVN